MGSTVATTMRQVEPTARMAQTTSDDPCYTIAGTITRMERTATSGGSGYTTSTVPVRFAHI
jgi:hypothetical protein